MESFDPIEYLSGLTTYVFDKALLRRVAYEIGISAATSYDEITEEQADLGRISLYEAIYYSPYSTGGYTQKHGDFTVQVGQQVITEATREIIGAELRRLYKKLGLTDKEEALGTADSIHEWVDENYDC